MRQIRPISKAYYEAFTALASEAAIMPGGLSGLRSKAKRALGQTTSYEFIQLYDRALIGKRDDHLAVLDQALQDAMVPAKINPSENFVTNIVSRFGDRSPTLRAAIIAGGLLNDGGKSVGELRAQFVAQGVLSGLSKPDDENAVTRDEEAISHVLALFKENSDYSLPAKLQSLFTNKELQEFCAEETQRIYFGAEAFEQRLIAHADVHARVEDFIKIQGLSVTPENRAMFAKVADKVFSADDVKTFLAPGVDYSLAYQFLMSLDDNSPLIGVYKNDAPADMFDVLHIQDRKQWIDKLVRVDMGPYVEEQPHRENRSAGVIDQKFDNEKFIVQRMPFLPPHLFAACYWERELGSVEPYQKVADNPAYKAALIERFETITSRMSAPDAYVGPAHRDHVAWLAYKTFRDDPDFLIDKAIPALFPAPVGELLSAVHNSFIRYAELFIDRDPERAQKYLKPDFMVAVAAEPSLGDQEHPAHRLFILTKKNARYAPFDETNIRGIHQDMQRNINKSLAAKNVSADPLGDSLPRKPSKTSTLVNSVRRHLGLGD